MQEIPSSETGERQGAWLNPLQRSLGWLKQGRTQLALPLLQKLARRMPDNLQVRHALAAAHLRSGQPQQALAGFNSILSALPEHAGALQGRGLSLQSLGDRLAALDAFRQLVSIAPLSWRAWTSIADITPHEDDRIDALEGAADALHVICQKDSARAADVAAAAEALLNARKPEKAQRLLEIHGAARSANPVLIRLLARSLYHQGRFAQAFAAASRLLAAVRVSPPRPSVAFDPGRAIRVLIEVQSILAGAGIPSFLAAGTLLGFHRAGAPLRHDRDIDIGVLRAENGGPDIAGVLRNHPAILLPAISRPGDRYFGLRHKGVAVDIFLHDDRDRHLVCGLSSLPGDIQWRLNAFSLKTAFYGGRSWTIPSEPERYLNQSYGPGWQTADPGFASAVSSPALYETDPYARSYYAVIRACRARAAGDLSKTEALLGQSPVPVLQTQTEP